MLGAKCVRLLNILIIVVGGMVRHRWIVVYTIIIANKFLNISNKVAGYQLLIEARASFRA